MILEGLQQLRVWDHAIFHWINHDLYWRPLADLVFWLARDQLILIFLAAAAAGYAVRFGWKRALELGAWGAAAIVVCNLLQNQFLKPFFNRARPFMSLSDIHLSAPLLDLSMVSMSFPSTHSASAAALAITVMQIDRHGTGPVWIFALVIGLGTIYSGGHYPLDVLAGYGVGLFCGWGLMRIRRAQTWLLPQTVKTKDERG